MTEANPGPDDDPNDEPKLMTTIDGQEARLLVHIEPIEDTDANPRTGDERPPLGE
jgi:hypothetical protein